MSDKGYVIFYKYMSKVVHLPDIVLKYQLFYEKFL